MSVLREMYQFDQDDEFCRKDMLDDLQLAAELGKTLLERNKELETSLKQHQNIIEDQTQEIEYLTKQTVALREVNDSRLRIYEQLEVSIHDLERANHRLTLDASADKKQIKSLCSNVDSLEARCDELQATADQLTAQLDAYKRRCERIEAAEHGPARTTRRTTAAADSGLEMSHDKQVQCDSTTKPEIRSCSVETSMSPMRSLSNTTLVSSTEGSDVCDGGNIDSEQINVMLAQLRDIRAQRGREQRRVCELEEQLAALVQENQALETQLVNASTRDEDMKSMHDELNTLDEVRQGQLCARCLRNVDDRMGNDDMSILDTEEEDDDNMSMMEALISETRYRSSVSLNIQQDSNQPAHQSNNLYRDLVEKYEALLAVNRNHHKPTNCMSLQEELQMSGDFNNIHAKDTDEESGHGDSYNMNSFDKHVKSNSKDRKTFSQTPTDFSEAETSSSGFADETSNKSTQTDGRPGSFLCTIADGEDCKFSIYDDASPIDSRFRNRPEYRELFKEIFTVLKKAAENKDEGEELPLLDDCTPVTCIVPKVPPVTPATEDFPAGDFTDDNQSVISSAMSDTSIRSAEPPTVVENVPTEEPTKPTKEIQESPAVVPKEEKAPILMPYKREPLEYVSVSVNVRKKSSAKKNNKKQFVDRSDSPVLPLSPRISYLSNGSSGRKRKEFRPTTGVDNNQVWNGSTLQFWSSNRNVSSPTPSQNSGKSSRYEKNSCDFKPSTASQDLNKLKRLDLSYAEVLRNADNKKREAFAKSAVRRK